MSSPKRDSEPFDGKATLVDPPPPASPADSESRDLEDDPTDLWAPARGHLFSSGAAPARPPDPEEADTERMAGPPAKGGLAERLSRTARPDASGEAGPEASAEAADPAAERPPRDPRHDTDEVPPEGAAGSDPERDTDPALMDHRAAAGELHSSAVLGPAPQPQSGGPTSDTVRMPYPAPPGRGNPPGGSAADTVEVTGEEADAARRLLEQAQSGLPDPARTLQVDRPRSLPRLTHECRMCGRRITAPGLRRLRGPADSEVGFRCERCSNVFCAAHVVRVSGLISSLVHGARFRCQLCLPGRDAPDS